MWNKLKRSGWRAAEKSGAQGSIAARTRKRSRFRVWQPAPANRHRSTYSDTVFDTRQTMADQLRALVAARDGPKNNAEHKGGWAVARRAAGLRVGRLRRPTPRLPRCPADKLAQTKLREKELKDAHKAELEQQKQKKEEVRRRARGWGASGVGCMRSPAVCTHLVRAQPNLPSPLCAPAGAPPGGGAAQRRAHAARHQAGGQGPAGGAAGQRANGAAGQCRRRVVGPLSPGCHNRKAARDSAGHPDGATFAPCLS